MSSLIVPTFKDLSFYSNPDATRARYSKLVEVFKAEFGCSPQFFTRAPGRVNLIGDHIDYCHFSVLPMAIDVDMVVAIATSDDNKVQITNTDEMFKNETIILPEDGSLVQIDPAVDSWGSYVKCSLIVAQQYILEKKPELLKNGTAPLKGLKLAFNGTVPAGGGLSSSAAICVASTLAIVNANGIDNISKEDLTRITVVTEHYVGLDNGGMDQCASIYGEDHKALLIQFQPKLIGIPFEMPKTKPRDMAFLITNSLIKANKRETAPTDYNLRVVETSIAAEYLAKKFNLLLKKESNLKTGTLRGFMDTYFVEHLKQPKWDGNDIKVGITQLEEMLKLTETLFTEEEKEGFATPHMAESLGLSQDKFNQLYLDPITVRFEKLKIYQRTKHVYSDSLRVLQVIYLFQKFDASADSEIFLRNFGKLLNDSHKSSDKYMNNSKEDLNKICQISLSNGSYGARVTGAGFGGSCVHLTTEEKLPQLVKALTEEYYKPFIPDITEDQLSEAIVVSHPAAGCCTVILDCI